MRNLRLVLTAAACSLALACATVHPWPAQGVLSAAGKDGPGRLLFEELTVRFASEGGEPVAYERRVRQVLIEGPRTKYLADDNVGYDRTFTSILDFRARARLPDGKERSWGQSDAQDSPAFGGSILYSDNRSLVLDLPELPAGTVVEHVVETKTRSPQHFLFTAVFERTIPADAVSLEVEAPAGWKVEWVHEKNGATLDDKPRIATTDLPR